MKQKMLMMYSLIFSSMLGACSKTPAPKTEVFPPTLSFKEEVTSYNAYSEEYGDGYTEESVVIPEIDKVQLIPEYPVASSFLEEWQGESYHAFSTMDGDISTAWVEDGSGLGVNEWIEHHFEWEESVQEVAIYNGHGGVKNQFGTARKIRLSFSNGEEFSYNLEEGWNEIVLERPISTTFVRMTILQGTAGSTEDVAISEMRLYNHSSSSATEVLSNADILKNMGALGDCSNITPEQARAFASELQKVISWAETTSATRAYLGDGYEKYTAEAMLFAGGDGVPVLYYDYDFVKVDELFLTSTDVIVWDGNEAKSAYFEELGRNTSVNWIIPGYVYVKDGDYYFGLTEYDAYGSGTFGLIAMVPFEAGMPAEAASYLAFLSHRSMGVFTYEQELADYLLMPVLSQFPTQQLASMVVAEEEAYYEFDGTDFVKINLVWDPTNYATWYTAIRNARVQAGYEQVTRTQSGDTVLAGLLALS